MYITIIIFDEKLTRNHVNHQSVSNSCRPVQELQDGHINNNSWCNFLFPTGICQHCEKSFSKSNM